MTSTPTRSAFLASKSALTLHSVHRISSLPGATRHGSLVARPAPPTSLSPSISTPLASPALTSSSSLARSFSTRAVARMSTMPASHGHNEACCNIPAVVAKDYEAKGSYEEIGGKKTYVTGPEDATKAILFIFDIFGYFPQTLQGADILAYSDDHQKYKVFIPDWFDGEPLPIELYPPDNEEKQKKVGAFFGKNSPPKVAGEVPDYVKALKDKYPSVADFGIIGFCWGGKVVALVTSKDKDLFKVAASCHPAMVDPKDAEGIQVPVVLLASKEEPVDKVKQFGENLKVPNHVETFSDQIHGWMAARADLEDARVKEEYTRGYKTVLEFFGKHI